MVTEDRARQLSQPRFDAQGKPLNPDPSQARQAPATNAKGGATSAPAAPAGAAAPSAQEKVEEDPAKRKVRAVGPAFYPAR